MVRRAGHAGTSAAPGTRSYLSFSLHGMRWQARADFAATATFGEIARIDEHWRPETGQARHEQRRRWSFVRDGAADEGSVFVKYYLPRNRYEPLKYLLRPTRASAEWRHSLALAKAGVPVPEVLAVGQRRRFGLWRQSLLVTRPVAGGRTLLAFSEECRDATLRRRILDQLATAVAAMHRAGCYHRDLHGNNILVDGQGPEARVLFADFHELLRLRIALAPAAIADLARLNGFVEAGARERLRFAVRYLRARAMPRHRVLPWVRAVDRRTRRLWSRYRARGVEYARY